MQVSSDSTRNGTQIGDTFAVAVPVDAGHRGLTENINLHLAWSDVPDRIRSFVITRIGAHCSSSQADVTYSLNPPLR